MATSGRRIIQLGFAALIIVFMSYGFGKFGLVNWPSRYDPFALPDLKEKPYWLTYFKLKIIDNDLPACMLSMSGAGLNSTLSEPRGEGTPCEFANIFHLAHLETARLKPEDTRCNIAARLYMWERNVLQPAAMRHFGVKVAEIMHFGSYNCRTIRGSSSMSEHAHGNAFDISGFRLKNGQLISVLKDWESGPSAEFLHEARDGLCDVFNLTLSPDYNSDHKDHFHVDMGWVRGCH